MRPKRNKTTQTSKLLPGAVISSNKRTTKTQTHITLTDEILPRIKNPSTTLSISTQTDQPSENEIVQITPPSDLELDSDASKSQSDSDEDYVDEDENLELNCQKPNDSSIILSINKPPQDQIKVIVFEESIVQRFGVCSTCGSSCTVSLQHSIGTYCNISVHCNGDSSHNFMWSTGPLSNRLPILNLMIASSVLFTGLECAKALRLFHSLNIKCFKRRELSNLLTGYVIPAVYNVWKKEQLRLVNMVKNTPVCIASDMRVDSPGHTGLFGSGSSLDVDRNIVLDTQIIKVFETSSTQHNYMALVLE